MEVAPTECHYPYFFQSFLTESEGEVSACRLRRSDTTGFTLWEKDNVGSEYDKGIFIDIFPLFNIPDSMQERCIQKEAIMFFGNVYVVIMHCPK
jgi:lipopolysaccharide cholinephosphotransferase